MLCGRLLNVSTCTFQTEVFIFHSLHMWINVSGARTSHVNVIGIFFFMTWPSSWGQDLFIIEVSRSHSVRHATLGRTALYEWSAHRRRPLPDKTQHPQDRDIHAPSRIRTRKSKQAAADPLIRPGGQRSLRYRHCTVWIPIQNARVDKRCSEFCAGGLWYQQCWTPRLLNPLPYWLYNILGVYSEKYGSTKQMPWSLLFLTHFVTRRNKKRVISSSFVKVVNWRYRHDTLTWVAHVRPV